jgi:hypothetical protein
MPADVIPVRRNVNDAQRPNRPISAADAAAEPPATRTFPEQADLPAPAARLRTSASSVEPSPKSLSGAEGPDMTKRPAPAAPAAAPKPQIVLSTTVEYRGRLITIQATDLNADAFCDLLDKRGFVAPTPASAPTAPVATPDDLPDGWKLCQRHGAPMRPRNKQNEHWHSHNVGTKEVPVWCKGYRGADSPGFDL